ncbi:MAG: tRNA preQ1(34) S-adenosylmethionine ribosyltransferase-isomerase QueA [Acidobacteriota bacterium]|nr:tRNA preQ1(34) S-adenosylmethionine ribosyltransferase-isomerase QueA [Acidobacteriota bacterium]
MRVSDFDFDLPEKLIAQQPPAERGTSRMLIVDREGGGLQDSSFAQFPSQLNPGDVLVLNDSRVIPARLFARRTTVRQSQAATGFIEVLLTEQTAPNEWRALVKPGKKVGIGDRLAFSSHSGVIELEAEVLDRGEFGERLLRFKESPDFFSALDRIGHMPLPPYIHRDDQAADRTRYQTVFSRDPGSVAAPTAGLHFTTEALAAIEARGVDIARITLHVGLGTFAPLRVERVADVHLHRERYTLSAEAAATLNRARAENRRIVAVGTTVVRTLEHCALHAGGNPLTPHSGSTQIFISPGFPFQLVNALLTNFHLPQSSLLMLVSAFAGRERVLAAYEHAVREKYRFFSYGDCMFLR